MHSLLDHSKLSCNIEVGKAIVETAVHFHLPVKRESIDKTFLPILTLTISLCQV